jgi:double-stranded uracil-DNA glycosylase
MVKYRQTPSMPWIYSFAPVIREGCNTLILGSMPGEASLKAAEYYAHPRNQFWPIVLNLLEQPPTLSYQERLNCLQHAGLGLWDVLGSCTREGSLDQAIQNASANDFGTLLTQHPHIQRVFFNGAKAETLFRRLVLPGLPQQRPLTLQRLPSTSPAHAGWSQARKQEAWRAIIARDQVSST